MNNMKTTTLIKNLKRLAAAIVTGAFLPLSAFSGPAVLDSAINPANGHVYYLLANSDWTNAEIAAVGLGGHLATIRNLAENTWVWNRWGTNQSLWIGLHDPVFGDGSGAQHAANFVWSSGESSAYRNWNSGDPNNTGGLEYFAAIMGTASFGPSYWNDAADSSGTNIYGVAEVPVCTPSRYRNRHVVW
jgi:hypothetical protein